jgi:uncharacterized ubiquitin-like protein YukD
VVLDLFDRRMETYTALRKVVAKVMASSSAATTETSFEFLRAMDRAEFLFGDEIGQHLKKIDVAINEIRIVLAERNGLQGPELKTNVASERAARDAPSVHERGRLIPAVCQHGAGIAGIGRVDGGENVGQPRRGLRHARAPRP